MPFPLSIIGRSTVPITHEIDSEWLDAFAAAVNDRSESPLAHPLFPVCIEWPAVMAAARLDDGELLADERRSGVHATHDLTIHRRLRAGDTVTTTATVDALETRPRGTLERLRLETRDDNGSIVAATIMGSMFLGVNIDGGAAPTRPARDEAPDPTPHREATSGREAAPATIAIDVAADQARDYSEAARIWNPIHTDAAAAARAGLVEPILHGTCTLAMAISAALGWAAEGADANQPEALRRVQARFSGMVTMPSRIELCVWRSARHEVNFEVVGADHTRALREGRLGFTP